MGYPGSIGLERGNIDIVYALVITVLVINRLSKSNISFLELVLEATLIALMVNSKITILPIAIVFLLTTSNMYISLIGFIVGYITFSYMPYYFNVVGSIGDSYQAAKAFDAHFPNKLASWCWYGNHVIKNIPTYFINCSKATLPENTKIYNLIVTFLSSVLFIVIFVLPLRGLYSFVKYITSLDTFLRTYKKLRNEIFLVGLTLAVASINLLPFLSFGYRLYFSLPCIFGLFHLSRDSNSKKLILYSIICLLVKSMWIIDIKLINIFVNIHYYLLILASSIILVKRLEKLFPTSKQ